MLPSDISAEQSILGSCLLSDWSADQALTILAASDFYRPEHQRIFRAIAAVSERSEGIDLVTVRSEMLREMPESDPAILYLHDLIKASVGRGNVPSQCKVVLEHATRRKVAAAANQIAAQSYDLEFSLEDLVSNAESSLLDSTSAYRGGDEFSGASEIVDSVIAEMEEAATRTGLPGISSGISSWDYLTQGMEAGGLYIVAGRPAMGKTAAAISMASHACRAGLKCGFFSLEMKKNRVLQRMIAGEASVSLRSIRTGTLRPDERQEFIRATRAVRQYNLKVEDKSSLTVSQIVSICRRMRSAMAGLDIIFVDYIGIVKPDSSRRAGSRAEEVSLIAYALKAAAKQLDIPVVALAQIGRAVEGRENKRPGLSDLKESGGIEEAADVVTGVYRPCYYQPQEAASQDGGEPVEWIVLKCRDGETGTAKLAYYGPYTRFEDTEVSYDFES